ncbi:MAG: glycosyltransferase family 4 protein, partial [Methylophilaceae bacterium]
WLRNNVRLICFGGGRFESKELDLIKVLGLSENHVMQAGGSDAQLAEYYRKATAFVYPSLYEGFGIPPLEAMSLNCPVICSNTSSIPEVVGGAAEYFVPDDIASMRCAIESVLQSEQRRNELIRMGAEQCKDFSWPRCASETLAVYQRVI